MTDKDYPISNDLTSSQNNRVIPLDVELKNKFDPNNFFSFNLNISPTVTQMEEVV